MAQLRLSVAAQADLKAIYEQSAEMFGLNQADIYAAGLLRALNLLAAYPLSSRLRTEFSPPVRTAPYKAHVIIYDVSSEGVLVIRIRHSHEDWAPSPSASAE